MLDKSLLNMAMDKEITGLVWRCLAYLISKMDYDNLVHAKQSDIVNALGASQQKVSASLNLLAKKSYITIDASQRPQVYKVSENIAQKGAKKSHKNA